MIVRPLTYLQFMSSLCTSKSCPLQNAESTVKLSLSITAGGAFSLLPTDKTLFSSSLCMSPCACCLIFQFDVYVLIFMILEHQKWTFHFSVPPHFLARQIGYEASNISVGRIQIFTNEIYFPGVTTTLKLGSIDPNSNFKGWNYHLYTASNAKRKNH